MNTRLDTSTTSSLMTTSEFAALVGWACKTIYCRVSSGADMPPSLKIGKRRIWRRDEVEAWLESHSERTSIVL